MASVRTALGTASSKDTGLTLALNDVSLNAGDLLTVGLGYETDGGNPTSVDWGKVGLKIVGSTTETRGDTRCRLMRFLARRTATRNLVVTWSTTPTARALFATKWTEVSELDLSIAASLAASTSHDTGSAGTSTVANTSSIAAFVTGGPTTDWSGASAGSGHTLGQLAGTTGGADGTNVSIQETYETLTATGDIRASISGITSRLCACCVAAFKSAQTFDVVDQWYEPFDGNPESEVVVFVMNDEANNGFRVQISREEFNEMTDDEVRERIRKDCSWWATKEILNETSPDFTPDASFNSRISGFNAETFSV